MSKLTDYKLLSFDVYGTLIDWETGILKGLEPLTSQLLKPLSKKEILDIHLTLEDAQQQSNPTMLYYQVLATVYPQFAEKIGAKTPTKEEAEHYGAQIGSWPAFPDTVDALKRLSKFYKLVVLSNVDRESFAKSVSNPAGFDGFKFDKTFTAQDVGSYKPDLRNFEYMLKTVKEDFEVEKAQVLQTAQSQHHDHRPAKKMGIKSVWIERRGTMGNKDEAIFDWKFETMGDMADAVEKEAAENKA